MSADIWLVVITHTALGFVGGAVWARWLDIRHREPGDGSEP